MEGGAATGSVLAGFPDLPLSDRHRSLAAASAVTYEPKSCYRIAGPFAKRSLDAMGEGLLTGASQLDPAWVGPGDTLSTEAAAAGTVVQTSRQSTWVPRLAELADFEDDGSLNFQAEVRWLGPRLSVGSPTTAGVH